MFKYVHDRSYYPRNVGGMGRIEYNGTFLVGASHWVLDSCGINTLHSFGGFYTANPTFWKSSDLVNKLVSWLSENKLGYSHAADEYLFSLTNLVVDSGSMNALIKHPCVKQIDRFKNKSHGPCDMLLYRLSISKDFPK